MFKANLMEECIFIGSPNQANCIPIDRNENANIALTVFSIVMLLAQGLYKGASGKIGFSF